MAAKKGLYLASGAKAVWICTQAGSFKFYTRSREASSITKGFQNKIELYLVK